MPPKPSARLSVGCVTNSWDAFDQCLKQRLYSLRSVLKNRVAEEKWGSVAIRNFYSYTTSAGNVSNGGIRSCAGGSADSARMATGNLGVERKFEAVV